MKHRHADMNIVVDPFKVRMTKDGRYAVCDTSYAPAKIVSVHDRDEKEIAFAAAKNLNAKRRQDHLSNANFWKDLKGILSYEQYMKETMKLL